MKQKIWDGGCICGQVRFQITGKLADVIGCHCRQCRRMSGHYFAATAVPHANLVFTCSEGLARYASSQTSRRGFCRNCGASLFFDHGPDEPIGIASGLNQTDGTPSVLYQTYGAPRIVSPVSSAGRRVPAMPDIGQRA